MYYNKFPNLIKQKKSINFVQQGNVASSVPVTLSPHPNRFLIVSVHRSTDAATTSNLSVNGVAANRVFSYNGVNLMDIDVYTIAVPMVSSVNLDFTWTTQAGIYTCYEVLNCTSITPVASGSGVLNANPQTFGLTMPDDSLAYMLFQTKNRVVNAISSPTPLINEINPILGQSNNRVAGYEALIGASTTFTASMDAGAFFSTSWVGVWQ